MVLIPQSHHQTGISKVLHPDGALVPVLGEKARNFPALQQALSPEDPERLRTGQHAVGGLLYLSRQRGSWPFLCISLFFRKCVAMLLIFHCPTLILATNWWATGGFHHVCLSCRGNHWLLGTVRRAGKCASANSSLVTSGGNVSSWLPIFPIGRKCRDHPGSERWSDQVKMSNRSQLANRRRVELMSSLHCNWLSRFQKWRMEPRNILLVLTKLPKAVM